MQEHIQMLRQTPLFAGIPEEDIEKLSSCLGCKRAAFSRDEVVWLADDEVTACGVVLSGAVRAESISHFGSRSVLARHGVGAVFGNILMSTPDPRSPVDIIAAADTEVFFIPFRGLMASCANCCDGHDRLRLNLLGDIARQYWALSQRIKYLSSKSLRAKLSWFLLDRSKDAGSATFSTGCSRADLADILGANRSALSRELSRMKEQGIIDYYRDTFKILDFSRLEGD